MKEWLKGEWKQISTKLGVLVAALNTVTIQFVQYDHRLVFVAYALAFGLVLFPENDHAEQG